MTKQQVISAKIANLIAQGMDIAEALDAVCGAGTYEKLASDVYHELRAKAA